VASRMTVLYTWAWATMGVHTTVATSWIWITLTVEMAPRWRSMGAAVRGLQSVRSTISTSHSQAQGSTTAWVRSTATSTKLNHSAPHKVTHTPSTEWSDVSKMRPIKS
jgi:hypothetical protein